MTTQCARCKAALDPDVAPNQDPDEVKYQFENALWIAFHGGYGMFVDNIDATMYCNDEDRWLTAEDGKYFLQKNGDLVRTIENPDFVPHYKEERILPGRPDYEIVICHECAHKLCDENPWLARIINPHGSHSHKTQYVETHPDHYGWDYDRHKPHEFVKHDEWLACKFCGQKKDHEVHDVEQSPKV